jgi:hypothetical protein
MMATYAHLAPLQYTLMEGGTCVLIVCQYSMMMQTDLQTPCYTVHLQTKYQIESVIILKQVYITETLF